MAFSDFDLRAVVDRFALREDLGTDLFADVPPLEPTEFTRTWLQELAPVAQGVNSEKARSEFIIAPLLVEARRRAGVDSNVLPGVMLDVDRERGLFGFCDFIISRSIEYYYLRGPLAAVVEAKREDLIGGLGQCAASMVALRLFNERDGTPLPAIFGAVTSGTNWKFLKLAGDQLTIDRQEYYLREANKIVGILVHIITGR